MCVCLKIYSTRFIFFGGIKVLVVKAQPIILLNIFSLNWLHECDCELSNEAIEALHGSFEGLHGAPEGNLLALDRALQGLDEALDATLEAQDGALQGLDAILEELEALDGDLDGDLDGTLQGVHGAFEGLHGAFEALEVHNFRPLLICFEIQFADSRKFFKAMFWRKFSNKWNNSTEKMELISARYFDVKFHE